MGVSREDSLVSISNTETSEAVKIKRFRNFLKKPVISHDWSLDFDVFLCEKLNRLTIFSFDFEGKKLFCNDCARKNNGIDGKITRRGN